MIPYDEMYLDTIADRAEFDRPFWRVFANRWIESENTSAEWNPFACTQTMPGSTQFNSAGVQNYRQPPDGIQAFLWTIDPRDYGGVDYYPHLRMACQIGSIDKAGRSDVAKEIRTWGTSNFALEIEGGFMPDVSKPDIDLNTAILRRLAAIADAMDECARAIRRAADPENIP